MASHMKLPPQPSSTEEFTAALDALLPGMTVDEAATTIAAFSDFRVAVLLIDDHGLDLDALEHWIATTTGRAVLRRDLIAT